MLVENQKRLLNNLLNNIVKKDFPIHQNLIKVLIDFWDILPVPPSVPGVFGYGGIFDDYRNYVCTLEFPRIFDKLEYRIDYRDIFNGYHGRKSFGNDATCDWFISQELYNLGLELRKIITNKEDMNYIKSGYLD